MRPVYTFEFDTISHVLTSVTSVTWRDRKGGLERVSRDFECVILFNGLVGYSVAMKNVDACQR